MIKNEKIYVVDSPMGSGKTTAMIEYMNSHPEKRYLFITPFLDEVERIAAACPALEFNAPEKNELTKTINLQRLIQKDVNIVATHALFRFMNDETMDYLNSKDYVLILDEVIEVVGQEPISQNDIQMLLDGGYISIGKAERVHWCREDYQGRFQNMMQMAKNQELIYFRGKILMWLFPIDTFQCFNEIYILTYQFEGSRLKAYFDLWEEEYEYCHIQSGNQIVKGKADDRDFKENVRNLLTIYEGKLNKIGEQENALSATWFRFRSSRDKQSVQLRHNLYNYFRNKTVSTSEQRMWSVFADYQSRYEGDGYKTVFVPFNCRATNQYRNKSVLAYAVNIYEHPLILDWFTEQEVPDYQEKLALSYMLQWIWRSQIRDGKPVTLYLPSIRMRRLLIEWLNR